MKVSKLMDMDYITGSDRNQIQFFALDENGHR